MDLWRKVVLLEREVRAPQKEVADLPATWTPAAEKGERARVTAKEMCSVRRHTRLAGQ